MPATIDSLNLPPFTTASDATFQQYMQIVAAQKAADREKWNYEEEEDMPSKPLIAKPGFAFGCDPEGFIFDGDKPIPAAAAGIPGTKEDPYPVLGGAVQVDGMAAEFNIDPVDNYEDWETNITVVVEQLKSLLPDGLQLKFIPSVEFDPETFDKADDYSKTLGCQPDIDAYVGGPNPVPNPENPYVRCAGGHLHTSWTENESLSDLQHILNCQDLTKQYDWFLGAWSVLEDQDKRRRQLYGKAGACRYKPYGVEYRVLSNFWVNTKELRLAVWNRMNAAINAMSTKYFPDRVPPEYTKLLQKSINESELDANILYHGTYPIKNLQARYSHF